MLLIFINILFETFAQIEAIVNVIQYAVKTCCGGQDFSYFGHVLLRGMNILTL